MLTVDLDAGNVADTVPGGRIDYDDVFAIRIAVAASPGQRHPHGAWQAGRPEFAPVMSELDVPWLPRRAVRNFRSNRADRHQRRQCKENGPNVERYGRQPSDGVGRIGRDMTHFAEIRGENGLVCREYNPHFARRIQEYFMVQVQNSRMSLVRYVRVQYPGITFTVPKELETTQRYALPMSHRVVAGVV